MILHLVWDNPPTEGLAAVFASKPQKLVVDYAHPIPGWLEYRKTGDGTTHWVSPTALREAWIEPQPGDPDPMNPAPGEDET